MSSPELPEDPRHWPRNPFHLLGISPGDSPADVKRAYIRLIRRFKPEHHPEQFRLIREAYEACSGDGTEFFPQPEPAPSPPRRPPLSREAAPEDEPGPEEAPLEPVRSAGHAFDESLQLWSAAAAGRDAEAYAGLVRLAERDTASMDPPLQLYWLLALNPGLDSAKSRHDWLAEALVRSRLDGAAAELYRRELDAGPTAALTGPYFNLMNSTIAPSRIQLTVARWRLQAAGRSESWNPIDADVQHLAQSLPYQDEVAWLCYLVDVLDWVGWERPQPVHSRCMDELDRLRHLELNQAAAFDRVEAMEHLALAWRPATDTRGIRGVLGLIPYAWAAYGGLVPDAVMAAVAQIAAAPGKSLRQFDELASGQGRGILKLLYRVLADYRRARGPQDEPRFPPKRIRGLFSRIVDRALGPYPQMRAEVLKFLIGETVHPAELARACAGYPHPDVRAIAGELFHDLSLRVVWLAYRIHREGG